MTLPFIDIDCTAHTESAQQLHYSGTDFNIQPAEARLGRVMHIIVRFSLFHILIRFRHSETIIPNIHNIRLLASNFNIQPTETRLHRAMHIIVR